MAQTATHRPITLPLLATMGAMAAFQSGAAAAKGLFGAIGPEGAATLRLVLGAAMLMAIMRPWRRWPARAPIAPLIGLGVSMAAVILLFYLALARAPLGIVISLQFLGPLAIALFGSRKAIDLAWVALAGIGVWCLVGTGAPGAPVDPVGIAFALGAAAAWASYILFGRAAGAAFGASTAALAVTIAAVAILPVGLYHVGGALFAPALLPLALGIALLSAAIPFSLELYALPRIPARTFAVFTSLEPVFGAVFGWIVLHERLGATQAAGVVVIVVAAAGAAWTSARAAPLPTGLPD